MSSSGSDGDADGSDGSDGADDTASPGQPGFGIGVALAALLAVALIAIRSDRR